MKQSTNLLFFIILLVLVGMPFSVIAVEEECPFGLVNDTSPGQCGLYNDENSNELCDLSEPHNCTTEIAINNPSNTELSGEQLKTMTVQEVAKAYGIDANTLAVELGKIINAKVTVKDSLLILHDNNALGMSQVKEVAANIAAGTIAKTSEITSNRTQYYFLPIIIITTLLYFTTFILAKKDVMTIITHRKIWNWVLLLAFLVMAILSIILVVNKEYSSGIMLPINTLFWHVETGLVMVMISLFHIWWHLRYYFPKKKVTK